MLFKKDIKAWQFFTLYSFGMSHDSRSNGCHASKSEHFLYLMQSQLMAVSPLMKWSNCSKRAITEFIEYVVSAYLVKKWHYDINYVNQYETMFFM